jgi:hypothetical protein
MHRRTWWLDLSTRPGANAGPRREMTDSTAPRCLLSTIALLDRSALRAAAELEEETELKTHGRIGGQ